MKDLLLTEAFLQNLAKPNDMFSHVPLFSDFITSVQEKICC